MKDVSRIEDFLHEAKNTEICSESGNIEYIKDLMEYRNNLEFTRDCLGQELIKEDNRLIWGLNYYGVSLVDKLPEGFKAFLQVLNKNRFSRSYDNCILAEEAYSAKVEVKGDISFFKGEEKVYYNDKLIYKIIYQGGELN